MLYKFLVSRMTRVPKVLNFYQSKWILPKSPSLHALLKLFYQKQPNSFQQLSLSNRVFRLLHFHIFLFYFWNLLYFLTCSLLYNLLLYLCRISWFDSLLLYPSSLCGNSVDNLIISMANNLVLFSSCLPNSLLSIYHFKIQILDYFKYFSILHSFYILDFNRTYLSIKTNNNRNCQCRFSCCHGNNEKRKQYAL